MTTQNEVSSEKSQWTIDTLREHIEVLRSADEKFQVERDRRYAEVATERALAMKIKETADLAALELARESQVYKDERNDAMREQTLGAAGIYATHVDVANVTSKMETSIALLAERMEAALAPLSGYVAAQKGSIKGTDKTIAYVIAGVSVLFGLAGFVVTLIKLWG